MDKLDPDYASYNTALEQNEEEDKRENLVKLRKIIEEVYSEEISQRQDQIEEIELRICKYRKLLHLLRYALIVSYYKKKELECTEEEPVPNDVLAIPDKQSRIHPAVKRLLGKNSTLERLTPRNKRTSPATLPKPPQIRTPPPETIVPESKRIKLEEVAETPSRDKNETKEGFIRSRKVTKRRVVIGNISKWISSAEGGPVTHQWMLYVRGPKEKADVSDFIEKVVFHLHDSFDPNVIEVSKSPFHLSNRGWGDFPVRVQIFFKLKFNKPIHITHDLKLDKSFTGRQTLGNETNIEITLYQEKGDGSDEEETQSECLSTSNEHDYCSGNVSNSINEHSYALPFDHPPVLHLLPKEKVEQDESNQLIYGLQNYIDCNSIKHLQIYNLNQKRKDFKFNNTKLILTGRRIDGKFIITNSHKQLIQVKKPEDIIEQVKLPKNRFKCMGEALPFIFKRLPLHCQLNNEGNNSRDLFWTIGKRRSNEWTRAKSIKKILLQEKVPGIEFWSTKAILMYGRSHCYTPSITFGLFVRQSDEKDLLLKCFKNSRPIVRSKVHQNDFDEKEINVETIDDEESPKKSKQPMIDITDERTKNECLYIRQVALDAGVFLKSEEIEDCVEMNGAERMIFEAVKCLADGLIRRARNHSVCTKSQSKQEMISRDDVQMAISERPELKNMMLRSHQEHNFLL